MTLNEQYLAGTILLEESVIWGIDGLVTADDFQSEHCRAIFEAAKTIKDEGGIIDSAAIKKRAQRSGVVLSYDYLVQLMELTPTTVNFAEYAKRVAEDARIRRIKELAAQIQEDSTSTPDELLNKMQQLAAEQESKRTSKPLLIRAADVAYEPPRWTLAPYFQRGKGTLIQGDNGSGKTAFMCAIAAHITTGEPLLGLTIETPGDVLMLSVEDDLSVLRGRIEANGGNLDRVSFMTNAAGLTFNSPEIEEAIIQTKAKMVIFDPIQAFLGAKVDMNRSNETRPELAKLFDMCDRHDCACAIIAHMGKSGADKSPVNRSLGSVDIPAAMRSILQLTQNPDNADERVMIHVKCSNAPRGQSIAYTIGERGGVCWTGFSPMTTDDLAITQKRKQKGVNYEQEPLVQVFNQLVTDKPGGGFWSYADLREAGAEMLGFPPFASIADLRSTLDNGLAKELQKKDGLIVTHGAKGPHNVKGIKIQQYRTPESYQVKIS